ncbi:unnamed protein product [Taenia asiatica]|uniref:Transmembrane protein n=1 Tax=Taenia asiatica TaxID=60517 RepID=A0A0R3VY21_TAEAS|nr:unnamed protein product [Taenia asiatica]
MICLLAGNALMVVMIEAIALSLGIFIWSIANVLLGFTTSRLGVSGISPKIPSKPVTNYVGVAIAVVSFTPLSIALYMAIKPSEDNDKSEEEEMWCAGQMRMLRRSINAIRASAVQSVSVHRALLVDDCPFSPKWNLPANSVPPSLRLACVVIFKEIENLATFGLSSILCTSVKASGTQITPEKAGSLLRIGAMDTNLLRGKEGCITETRDTHCHIEDDEIALA